MLLGQRLIQSGLLTIEQVQMALQLQVVHGGRIGTCLLKKGFIDIDGLANALSRHCGAPAAKLKHFEQADAETIASIPAQLALKHHAVPLARVARSGKEILVAFRDPNDMAAIDEIAFVVGARVHAFVAPELLIARYLERYYDVRPESELPGAQQQGRTKRVALPNPIAAREPSGSSTSQASQPLVPNPAAPPVDSSMEQLLIPRATSRPPVSASPAPHRPSSSPPTMTRAAPGIPHPSTWLSGVNGDPPRVIEMPRQSGDSRADGGSGAPEIPLAAAVEFIDFHDGTPPWSSEPAFAELSSSGPMPEQIAVDTRGLPAPVAAGPWEDTSIPGSSSSPAPILRVSAAQILAGPPGPHPIPSTHRPHLMPPDLLDPTVADRNALADNVREALREAREAALLEATVADRSTLAGNVREALREAREAALLEATEATREGREPSAREPSASKPSEARREGREPSAREPSASKPSEARREGREPSASELSASEPSDAARAREPRAPEPREVPPRGATDPSSARDLREATLRDDPPSREPREREQQVTGPIPPELLNPFLEPTKPTKRAESSHGAGTREAAAPLIASPLGFDPPRDEPARAEATPPLKAVEPGPPVRARELETEANGHDIHIEDVSEAEGSAPLEGLLVPTRPALSVEDALKELGSAPNRDEVGAIVVDFLKSMFGTGILFIVKDEVALGWLGFAPGLESSQIASIALPLATPSPLTPAWTRKATFRGAPSESSSVLSAHFFKMLSVTDTPVEVVVAPIMVRERIVNLIYAHAFDGGTIPDLALPDLTRIARAAGEAFVRVIKKRKDSVDPRP